jgi:hypothetical protein
MRGEKMNIPKTLIIGGVKWKIILDNKTSGGNFKWYSHTMKLDRRASDDRKFQILIHEIAEIILVNNTMRFQKNFEEVSNGDYLFNFNHDQFAIFTDELSGVLRQFTKAI